MVRRKFKYLIGIDEAGRGPLAGPITVGAVALPWPRRRWLANCRRRGIKDCKKLTALARERWFDEIIKAKSRGLDFSIANAGPRTIDRRGLTKTVRAAISRALNRLNCRPETSLVLLDGGLTAPTNFIYQKTIIRGDDRETIIAMASIVAKVKRDRRMCRLAKTYPSYGFDIHKGYGTKRHYEAIRKYGLSDIHRRSFLKNLLL